ncbi:protein bax [Enterobacter sp.]|uniref:protein bax n=1 Tax=Enterobacter sp. TaxID=42895 RepID=UPI002915B803|nr:protein bax [Enterobacter sp.]MDU7342814.1 protein bax [Enterobacter sp.]
MISTPIRRYGAAILMLLTTAFSGGVLAKTHTDTTSKKAHVIKTTSSKVSSKQEYSRNSAKSSSLPDLRKYPSGTPRKKAFLRARLKDITKRYKLSWNGNTRRVPWNALLERVDIIPGSMVATMAAAESGWGTSKLARNNNNLFGMKCVKGRCTNAPGKVKGYSQFESVKDSVNAYVVNLNTHPAYSSFRKSRAQLRKADQEVTASTMIHKLKGYSTKGQSYNNYLFAMYQDNQRLIAAHM